MIAKALFLAAALTAALVAANRDAAASPPVQAITDSVRESSLFTRLTRRLQADAACAADLNADGSIGTDDLLYMLAVFGRDLVGCDQPFFACDGAVAVAAQTADAALASALQSAETACQDQRNADAEVAQTALATELASNLAAAATQCTSQINAINEAMSQNISLTNEMCAQTLLNELQTCDLACQAQLQAVADTGASQCASALSDAAGACAAQLHAILVSAENNCTIAITQSLSEAGDAAAAELSTVSEAAEQAAVDCQATIDEQAAAAANATAQAAEDYQATLNEERASHVQAQAQMTAAHQQQLRALRCAPAPVLPFADVTGDFSYGGNGLTVTCHDGYADNGATSGTLQCTTAGTWEAPDGAPMLDCASIDPCSLDEDDCDALADCAHTGPATHECECTSGVAFGTGQVCSQCSPACDIGEVLTAPCTSTADIACEAVIASEVLPDITGATLSYSNEQSYPTTATYTCGDNEMSRTLQPDGTWSAAGEIDCGPPWILGAFGESCDTVCAAQGLPCTGGEWGVDDRASLEAALAEAGQSISDQASLCSGSSTVGHNDYEPYPDGRAPSVYSDARCFWQSGADHEGISATTNCFGADASARRLCRCA
jgi:hypothetical protein